MPWLMYVDYECAEVDGQVQLIVNVENVQSNRVDLCGRPYYSSESLLESATLNANS